MPEKGKRWTDGKQRQQAVSGVLKGLIFLFVFTPLFSAAQNYTIRLLAVDTSANTHISNIKVPENFSTAANAWNYLQKLIPEMQQRGFLAASLDSISVRENQYTARFFAGEKYKWTRVSFENVPPEVLNALSIKQEQWSNHPVFPKDVSRLSEMLLQWAENNGYPFAAAGFKVDTFEKQNEISGNFYLHKGPFIKLDSIVFENEETVSRNFLLHYLELKEGLPYDESKLKKISTRIRELPFLQEAQPHTIQFKRSETRLQFYLKPKKANQLNALIGLLPNSVETGKFLLTVDAQLRFQNILGSGESVFISYQNLQFKSPRLKANFVYPYLFNTLLGLDADFDLYKKDTAFRRTQLQAGVRYQFNAISYLRVYYQNRSNRLITVDTAFVKSRKMLPENVDVTANGAGAEWVMNKTDYRLNPRRGFEVQINAAGLKRKVNKSDAITGLKDATGFDYGGLYDTLENRSNQYQVHGSVGYYFPLGKQLVLKTAYSGGWISGENLFRNELYQIGGFRLLRGFDEQSIFTNQYHVATIELRLLTADNSFVYAFSDDGFVRSDFGGLRKGSVYNGFGIGATLETKTGLFSISYALGANTNNPVQFRQSKIHFGYVAFF